MLSGLFGTSTLLLGLIGTSAVPPQRLNKRTLELDEPTLESALSRSTLIGILASFFPGLGASQGAILASATTKKSFTRVLSIISWWDQYGELCLFVININTS